jgi:hypothetical protein
MTLPATYDGQTFAQSPAPDHLPPRIHGSRGTHNLHDPKRRVRARYYARHAA